MDGRRIPLDLVEVFSGAERYIHGDGGLRRVADHANVRARQDHRVNCPRIDRSRRVTHAAADGRA